MGAQTFRSMQGSGGWVGVWMGVASIFAAPAAFAAPVTVDVYPVPTAGSRPYTITPGPDGNLWFTESLGDKIGRIMPDGVITEFAVPTLDSGPYGIAAGADGNIWFTERFADQIGRLDPDTGQIAEFPVPTSFAQPWEIVAGPDGNLWFTEEDVHQIGRITPTGVVSEFPAGACCFPTGIAAGADGNLWYTIEIGDIIGRMAPNGQTTLFPIETKLQLLLWDIIAGPDGNVWFTELVGRAIGRITPSGVINQFPVPGEFSGITGVAAGSDGFLWFTENDTSRIGAMRASGTIRHQQDTVPDGRPLSMTHGPDGNMWFTLADANAIGRIRRARPDTEYVLSLDCGFAPQLRTARLGQRVQWTFLGPRAHAVTDATGLGLFDSGQQSIVSYYSFDFLAAGTYAYEDPEGVGLEGEIGVRPAVASQGTVGQPFPVTWATDEFADGFLFDVRVKTPGGVGFEAWQTGTAARSADFTPTVPGVYRFRARVRDNGGNATGYSPAASIQVSG